MKKNWLNLVIAIAMVESFLRLILPQNQNTELKPRRSGTRQPKYIGSIKLDQWVVEVIENLDSEEDLDLCLDCTGNFYIFNHFSERRVKELKNGITVDLEKVGEVSIPVKNIRDMWNAEAATVYCKYNSRSVDPFVDGLIKIIKKGD